MKLLNTLFLLIILSGIAYADDNVRKIHVTGTSKISLPAQYSIIHTNVKTTQQAMAESHAQLSLLLSQVIENLKKIGLTDKDITKSIIRQGPEYIWQNNSKTQSGYFSSCSMQLRVNDIPMLHLIYKELSRHDSLTINGTEYGRNDELKAKSAELAKALRATREKAALMASALDSKIGRVLTIRESGSRNQNTRKMYSSMETSSPGGGTFGMVDISGSVSVEFELK